MFIVILLVFIIIVVILNININSITTTSNTTTSNDNSTSSVSISKNDYYIKEYLFTKTELFFYYKLKKITNELNLELFAKTRIADLIGIKNNKNWQKNFNKIRSKHIDFIICKKNGKILTYIELDDYTHKSKKRIKRDKLINDLFYNKNHKIFRVKVKNNYENFFEELKLYLENQV